MNQKRILARQFHLAQNANETSGKVDDTAEYLSKTAKHIRLDKGVLTQAQLDDISGVVINLSAAVMTCLAVTIECLRGQVG